MSRCPLHVAWNSTLPGSSARTSAGAKWKYDYTFGGFTNETETGQGLGASHQTGWTALAVECIADVAQLRSKPSKRGSLEAVTSADTDAIPDTGLDMIYTVTTGGTYVFK